MSTFTDSREKHGSKHHHQDKDRERKDRSRSLRSDRSYQEWDETPSRFRDEPLTPQGRVRGKIFQVIMCTIYICV